jgi:hypothetical protein
MSRVTPTEVKAIVTTALTDPVIQIWIDAANSIVNASAACIGSDEVLLTQVELQLSAHLVYLATIKISSTAGFITEEGPDGFKTKYSNPVQFKNTIDNTIYGQAANFLSNGCLASLGDKIASVEFF